MMTIYEKKNKKGAADLALKGEIVIKDIIECKNALLPYVQKAKDLTLNLSEIEKIDTAGFQMLMAIKREIEDKNGSLKLIDISSEVSEIFTLYGEKF